MGIPIVYATFNAQNVFHLVKISYFCIYNTALLIVVTKFVNTSQGATFLRIRYIPSLILGGGKR